MSLNWADLSIGAALGAVASFVVSWYWARQQKRDDEAERARLIAGFAQFLGVLQRENSDELNAMAELLMDPAADTEDLYMLDPSDVRHKALLKRRHRNRLKLALKAENVPHEQWRTTITRWQSEDQALTPEERRAENEELAQAFESAGMIDLANAVRLTVDKMKNDPR